MITRTDRTGRSPAPGGTVEQVDSRRTPIGDAYPLALAATPYHTLAGRENFANPDALHAARDCSCVPGSQAGLVLWRRPDEIDPGPSGASAEDRLRIHDLFARGMRDTTDLG